MPNKKGLSTPEMPDTGVGFPSNVRGDLRVLADVAERRGTAFPTDADGLSDGDKFYRTDQATTYEYHATTATWVALAQAGGPDPGLDALTTHRTALVLDHPDQSVTAARIRDANVTATKLADGAATDAKVGPRTINQAYAPVADSGTLTALFGSLGSIIKGIKGTVGWRDPPPITLAQAQAHTVLPHETPTGSQAKVTAHSGAYGSHDIYFGTGGAPSGTGFPAGSLYRDQTQGHLYEYTAASGWKRVGMSIKSIQRVAVAIPSGNATGTIIIASVDITKAILAHMGVSAGGTGGNQDSSTMVTVGMQLISATQIQVSRGNTGSALTVFAQVVEWE